MSNKMNFNKRGSNNPLPGTRPPVPGQQQLNLNINVNTLENFVCGQCGSARFSQSIFIKRLPPLQSPTGKETVIFQPAGIICNDCGVPDDAIVKSDWDALALAHREQQARLETEDVTADGPKE